MAKNPFNEEFGGDLRLRACGGEEFYVHQSVMSIASPVFDGMFTVPQPPPPDITESRPQELSQKKRASHLPFVDLTEDQETINALLRCIYPVDKPVISNVTLAVKLVEAAEKYMLPSTCLYPVYIYLLRAGEGDLDNPGRDDIDLRFSLAWRLGFKRVALEASHGILCGSKGFKNLQSLTELSGDGNLQTILLSAKLARSEAVQRLSSLVSVRLGGLLCALCAQSATHPVTLASRAIEELQEILGHDWRERKAVSVDQTRLARCVNQTVERVMGQSKCNRCTKPVSHSYTGFTAAHEIPNAIEWPVSKQDLTPGML